MTTTRPDLYVAMYPGDQRATWTSKYGHAYDIVLTNGGGGRGIMGLPAGQRSGVCNGPNRADCFQVVVDASELSNISDPI